MKFDFLVVATLALCLTGCAFLAGVQDEVARQAADPDSDLVAVSEGALPGSGEIVTSTPVPTSGGPPEGSSPTDEILYMLGGLIAGYGARAGKQYMKDRKS